MTATRTRGSTETARGRGRGQARRKWPRGGSSRRRGEVRLRRCQRTKSKSYPKRRRRRTHSCRPRSSWKRKRSPRLPIHLQAYPSMLLQPHPSPRKTTKHPPWRRTVPGRNPRPLSPAASRASVAQSGKWMPLPPRRPRLRSACLQRQRPQRVRPAMLTPLLGASAVAAAASAHSTRVVAASVPLDQTPPSWPHRQQDLLALAVGLPLRVERRLGPREGSVL
mmetsp:Transcript_6160/g.15643  ORF Transcript_6160/g.15643 Transcript_6160/m.15643 type:complete len:222 (+) Transcript_6160:166-831(+)